MALFSKTETAKIAATSSATAAEFETGVTELHVIADGDCFISFDSEVATTSSYLVKSGVDTNPFTFRGGGPTKVWAITSGAAVNVYLLAIR